MPSGRAGLFLRAFLSGRFSRPFLFRSDFARALPPLGFFRFDQLLGEFPRPLALAHTRGGSTGALSRGVLVVTSSSDDGIGNLRDRVVILIATVRADTCTRVTACPDISTITIDKRRSVCFRGVWFDERHARTGIRRRRYLIALFPRDSHCLQLRLIEQPDAFPRKQQGGW